jgi:hypothetical protein
MSPQVPFRSAPTGAAALLLAAGAALLVPTVARAAWSADPLVNVPVATEAADQRGVAITSDGLGGAIIAWSDSRTGIPDIYAQRIDANGDTLWAAGGVPVCTVSGAQTGPQLAPDGAGGAILVWLDERGGDKDLWAQRIDANGVTQWAAGGLPVCVFTNDQIEVQIISDALGGAIVVWSDLRSDEGDVLAQRLDSSGSPLWTLNGLTLAAANRGQRIPRIAPDGNGGVIATWMDGRIAQDENIWATRVNFLGTHQWTVLVCDATGSQQVPQIVSDFQQGAVITWQDFRSGVTDIYAERIDPIGNRLWSSSQGLAVCTATSSQFNPFLSPDGAGGAIIAWSDSRTIPADIYAQRVSGPGAPLWAADGIPVASTTGGKAYGNLVTDGGDGAFLVWSENRTGDWDIYGNHLDGSGTLEHGVAGTALCTVPGWQWFNVALYDGNNGVIVAWEDDRASPLSFIYDVYSDRLTHSPPVAAPEVAPAAGLLLSAPAPNPVRSTTAIRFSLAERSDAELAVFDVGGRRVRSWTFPGLAAGERVVRWDGRDQGGRRVGSGVYLVRLWAQGSRVVTRATVVR